MISLFKVQCSYIFVLPISNNYKKVKMKKSYQITSSEGVIGVYYANEDGFIIWVIRTQA